MPCNSTFARKLAAYVEFSAEDFLALAAISSRSRKFSAGQDLIHQGQSHPSAYVLLQGWACSSVSLPNGTRQIVAFHIPGDTLGLRSILSRESDHSVELITDVEASEVLVSDMMDAFIKTPKLAMAVLWTASRDVAILVANLVGMGRRTAAERIAYCLLELASRLYEVGLGGKEGYACPLSQYQLADALGLSAVHVNRVLRNLRETGLLTFQKGQVSFDDFDRLVAFANFDRAYLDTVRPVPDWSLPRLDPDIAVIRLARSNGR